MLKITEKKMLIVGLFFKFCPTLHILMEQPLWNVI